MILSKKPLYKPDTVKFMFHRFLVGLESDDGETRSFCPLCEDPDTSKSPSASFNINKGVWSCRGRCTIGGTISDLVKQMRVNGFNPNSERLKGIHADKAASEKMRATPAARAQYRSTGDALPDEDQISDWNKRLLNSPSALTVMTNERGLTVDTIAAWGVGWDGQRYTIPVRDIDGELVNVRRYKPKASAMSDKMLNIPGYGTARLFRPDILRDRDEVVLCEGEMDCIILNQTGIPAVTHTAGAMTFQKAWGPDFEGKIVYICFDNDDTGRNGAAKAAKTIMPFAKAVYTMSIPMPTKGADVTDFIVKEGNGFEEFQHLMQESIVDQNSNKVNTRKAPPLRGRRASLEESMAVDLMREDLEMMVTISGKQNPPFVTPSAVNASCDMSKGPVCTNCPVFLHNGDMNLNFQPDDPTLFRFIDINEDRRGKLFKELTGARCSDHVEYTVDEEFTMEELVVSNSIDDRDPGEDQAPITRRIFSVGTHKTPVNSTVRLVGRNVADPKSGRQSFMAWHNEATQTSLDKFEMTNELRDALVGFQPSGGDSPLDKCRKISAEMEEHVTRIYGRQDLHVAYDLVWHSPISFFIQGRQMEKGWLEMMVVGDTRTGKSETAIQLAKHYQAGIVKSCEGATFAGLVGGVQQIGSNWTTTWGIIPLNDRRLVVLDEVSGLKDRDVIENMSSIRSSGRAQITKIAVEETSARTRLIWITNPGDGSMIADHPDAGLAAVRTVVRANEDIARFDFVMAATASEVESGIINRAATRSNNTMQYPSELCQALVLWAWSRRPDQVTFTAAAVRRGMTEAQLIGKRYTPDPPLLQTENARFKLYRIAAAIAARTFSTQDGETLLVTDDHVEDAVRFLDGIYSFEGMGYARRSRRIIDAHQAALDRRTACHQWLMANEDTVLHTLRSIGGTTFRTRDFKDMAGMIDSEGQEATKKLLGWKMIQRKSRGDLVMDRVLVDILRDIDDKEHEEL